jgi:hypothetical protein
MLVAISSIHPSLIFTRMIWGIHMGCFTNIRLGSDNHTRFKLLITTVKSFIVDVLKLLRQLLMDIIEMTNIYKKNF